MQGFLDCAKTYETVGLLGASTTSYDSQDPIMTRKPHAHVDADMIRSFLPYFTGPLLQYPPLFSAVKMDGKRLMDYARQNLPLPRPIEPREIEVVELELKAWYDGAKGEHEWVYPTKEIPEEDKKLIGRVKELAGQKEGETETVYNKGEEANKATEQAAKAVTTSEAEPAAPAPVSEDATTAAAKAEAQVEDEIASSSTPPSAFRLRMTVSSGTYVRSIVHDVGLACSSAAHVVELRRTKQGEWVTFDNEVKTAVGEGGEEVKLVEEVKAAPAEESAAPQPEAEAKDQEKPATAATGGIDLELRDDFDMGDDTAAADAAAAAEPTKSDAPAPTADTTMADPSSSSSTTTPAQTAPGTSLCLPWSLFADAHAEQQRVLANVKDVNSVKLRGEDGKELMEWEKELLRVLRPV